MYVVRDGFMSFIAFLVWITDCLYSGEPIGMTSVFAILNFAPEAVHHFLRMSWRSENLSLAVRYTVVSSAKSVVISFFVVPATLYPSRSDLLSISASGSMAKSNNRHDSGSPWRTPLLISYAGLITPFIIITVSAVLYSDLTILINCGGISVFSRIFHR